MDKWFDHEKLLIRRLAATEFAWANSRYAEVDFLPSATSDLVAVAEILGVAAGLGRVSQIDSNIGELGGMYVFPEHRGKGVSKSLIQFLITECNLETLYCLPFEHLAELYQSASFKQCHPAPSVPGKILEKHSWCNTHYPDPVLLMCRTNGKLASSQSNSIRGSV